MRTSVLTIHTAPMLHCKIVDGFTPDLIVGHDQALIIQRHDGGGHQADMVDFTCDPGSADEIACIEGTVDKDNHAGGKVGQRVTEAHMHKACGRQCATQKVASHSNPTSQHPNKTARTKGTHIGDTSTQQTKTPTLFPVSGFVLALSF